MTHKEKSKINENTVEAARKRDESSNQYEMNSNECSIRSQSVGRQWDSSRIKNNFVSIYLVRDEWFAPMWKERLLNEVMNVTAD